MWACSDLLQSRHFPLRREEGGEDKKSFILRKNESITSSTRKLWNATITEMHWNGDLMVINWNVSAIQWAEWWLKGDLKTATTV